MSIDIVSLSTVLFGALYYKIILMIESVPDPQRRIFMQSFCALRVVRFLNLLGVSLPIANETLESPLNTVPLADFGDSFLPRLEYGKEACFVGGDLKLRDVLKVETVLFDFQDRAKPLNIGVERIVPQVSDNNKSLLDIKYDNGSKALVVLKNPLDNEVDDNPVELNFPDTTILGTSPYRAVAIEHKADSTTVDLYTSDLTAVRPYEFDQLIPSAEFVEPVIFSYSRENGSLVYVTVIPQYNTNGEMIGYFQEMIDKSKDDEPIGGMAHFKFNQPIATDIHEGVKWSPYFFDVTSVVSNSMKPSDPFIRAGKIIGNNLVYDQEYQSIDVENIVVEENYLPPTGVVKYIGGFNRNYFEMVAPDGPGIKPRSRYQEYQEMAKLKGSSVEDEVYLWGDYTTYFVDDQGRIGMEMFLTYKEDSGLRDYKTKKLYTVYFSEAEAINFQDRDILNLQFVLREEFLHGNPSPFYFMDVEPVENEPNVFRTKVPIMVSTVDNAGKYELNTTLSYRNNLPLAIQA